MSIEDAVIANIKASILKEAGTVKDAAGASILAGVKINLATFEADLKALLNMIPIADRQAAVAFLTSELGVLLAKAGLNPTQVALAVSAITALLQAAIGMSTIAQVETE